MKPTASTVQIEPGHIRSIVRGELTLKYQHELKSIFDGLNEHTESIEIELQHVEGIDLCFLQMLESFRKEKSNSSQRITVRATLEGENEDLLKRTGLLSLLFDGKGSNE